MSPVTKLVLKNPFNELSAAYALGRTGYPPSIYHLLVKKVGQSFPKQDLKEIVTLDLGLAQELQQEKCKKPVSTKQLE